MRRLAVAVLGLIGVLLTTNALLERRRHCGCSAQCWCKSPVGQRLRWVIPLRHQGAP